MSASLGDRCYDCSVTVYPMAGDRAAVFRTLDDSPRGIRSYCGKPGHVHGPLGLGRPVLRLRVVEFSSSPGRPRSCVHNQQPQLRPEAVSVMSLHITPFFHKQATSAMCPG